MIDTAKIKSLIVLNGYTQRTLSEKLNISVNTLNAKINNKISFTVDEANELCKYLNVTNPDEKCTLFFSEAVS